MTSWLLFPGPDPRPGVRDFLIGGHAPAVDLFNPRTLGIDALARDGVWSRREAGRADAAWWTHADGIAPPIAARWGCPPSDPVERIRATVAAVLDRNDIEMVGGLDGEEKEYREREERFRENATIWQHASARLLRGEWDFAPMWAPAMPDMEESEAVLRAEDEHEAEIDRIGDEIRTARAALASALAAMEKLSRYRPEPIRKGGRKDRRRERFVAEQLTWAWRALIGTDPPRSKTGPFVRFCVAAWHDVGLPQLGDLDGAFGSIAEGLPKTGGANR